jgi:superfamily I DNA/RNA helicase
MTRLVPKAEWVPQDVTLEPTAHTVATSEASACVVAGPGAGKTELLAQRACYLLQTGTCPNPKRILAISFKRDAARTLRERVERRAGEFSVRFESYTFDAFAKSLLDRFLVCLPTQWRPPADYKIATWYEPDVESFLRGLRPPPQLGTTHNLAAIKGSHFMRDRVVGQRLPEVPLQPTNVIDWAAAQVWQYSIQHGRLSFPMIGRLAELILRRSPTVLQALRQTYHFVLLDEFQDSTHVQYDLTHTAFHGSSTMLTAVGDHKQRIMGWAMALADSFARFEADYGAKRHTLLMNYRSAPELVRIQDFMIKALDPDGLEPIVSEHLKDAVGSAEVLEFDDHHAEARCIADEIQSYLADGTLGPRDICVLTKQHPEVYAAPLLAELAARNLKGRVESDLQDLLVEPVTELVLAYLRLATQDRAPAEWLLVVEFACAIQAIDPHTPAARRVEQGLSNSIALLRTELARYATREPEVRTVVESVVRRIGKTALQQSYPQYRQGTFLDENIASFAKQLWLSVQRESSWTAALDDVVGLHAVPVMTIHKSKGLEYHTVIFLGLEDGAFWTFGSQQHEDTCAFFVAFSRAKLRVLFTSCGLRTTGPTRQNRPQATTNIQPLYEILRSAGVETRRLEALPKP